MQNYNISIGSYLDRNIYKAWTMEYAPGSISMVDIVIKMIDKVASAGFDYHSLLHSELYF